MYIPVDTCTHVEVVSGGYVPIRVLYRIFFARGGDQVHLIPLVPFPFILPHFTYNILLNGKILGGGEGGGGYPGVPTPLYKTLPM